MQNMIVVRLKLKIAAVKIALKNFLVSEPPSISIASTLTHDEFLFGIDLPKSKDAKETHFEGNNLVIGYHAKFGKQ